MAIRWLPLAPVANLGSIYHGNAPPKRKNPRYDFSQSFKFLALRIDVCRKSLTSYPVVLTG
jgi:hypothetical protein